MGSLTEGVSAGIAAYQRGKQLEELHTLRDRQALIERLKAVDDVRKFPAGKIRAAAIDEMLLPLGVPEAMRKTIATSNDEEYGALRNRMSELVADNPSVTARTLKSLGDAGYLTWEHLLKAGGDLETQRQQKELAGVLGQQPAPRATPTSLPPSRFTLPTEGEMTQGVPLAAQAPVDPLQALDQQARYLSTEVPKVLAARGIPYTPDIDRNVKAALEEINIQRKRFAAPEFKGQLTTGIDPATGQPAQIVVDVGKPGVVGTPLPEKPEKPPIPGTLAERVATNEAVAAGLDPKDPKVADRISKRALEIANQQIVAGRAVPEPKPPSESERLFFSKTETDVDAVDSLLRGLQNPNIRAVLGMSPEAWAARKAGKFYGPALTPEQNKYLATLAKQASQLRTSLAGQAQTVPEMRNLIPLIPTADDPPDVQASKLATIRNGMVEIYNNKRKDLLGYGMQGPKRQFGEAPSGEPPKPPSAKQTQESVNTLQNFLKNRR